MNKEVFGKSITDHVDMRILWKQAVFVKHWYWHKAMWQTIHILPYNLQFFEKGHQKNISVKLFQNLISGFRGEDLLTISKQQILDSSKLKAARQ